MSEYKYLSAVIPVSREAAELFNSGHELQQATQAAISRDLSRCMRDMQQPVIRIRWPEPIPEIGRIERAVLRWWARTKERAARPGLAWQLLRYGYLEDDE